MSQRNPMNERYTTEQKSGGSSRKSAASAKPKSSAAASVVQGVKTKKTKKDAPKKNNERRQQREKQYEAEKRYGDPPWKKFKIVKKIWIACLVVSVVMVALSFACSKLENVPEFAPTACLISAYVFIAITLYLDLGQIRRMKKKWVAIMSSSQTKEGRAEQKRIKAQERQAAKEAAKKEAEAKKNAKDKPQNPVVDKFKSFFGIK